MNWLFQNFWDVAGFSWYELVNNWLPSLLGIIIAYALGGGFHGKSTGVLLSTRNEFEPGLFFGSKFEICHGQECIKNFYADMHSFEDSNSIQEIVDEARKKGWYIETSYSYDKDTTAIIFSAKYNLILEWLRQSETYNSDFLFDRILKEK